MKTRTEKPVRNNPGIYREYRFDFSRDRWEETGRYRSMRRVVENGRSKKEQAVFRNIEDAKKFRLGQIDKPKTNQTVHHVNLNDPNQRYTFRNLVAEWKALHFLQVEFTTKQHYEVRLPHLDWLLDLNVSEINTNIITQLIHFWLSNKCKKRKGRQTYERELDLLKVVLNFYRRHKNNAYFIPILQEHYKAANFAKAPEKKVRGIKELDVPNFLQGLKESYPQYYPIALIQIGLGLRIGEALALCWSDFDLERGVATIQRNLAWNKETRTLLTKNRKNARILEVALPEFLKEVLLDLKGSQKESAFLFMRNGGHLNRQHVSRAYKAVLLKVGINYLSGTHILRKTSGTLARKLTRDVYAASKLLDHSSVNITEKYYQEELDEDKIKVASALNEVISRSPVPQRPANPTSRILYLVKSDR